LFEVGEDAKKKATFAQKITCEKSRGSTATSRTNERKAARVFG